jgi:hypothetical protein
MGGGSGAGGMLGSCGGETLGDDGGAEPTESVTFPSGVAKAVGTTRTA